MGGKEGRVLDFEHEKCSNFDGSQTSALPPDCCMTLSELLCLSEPRYQFQWPSKDLSLPSFKQPFLSDTAALRPGMSASQPKTVAGVPCPTRVAVTPFFLSSPVNWERGAGADVEPEMETEGQFGFSLPPFSHSFFSIY